MERLLEQTEQSTVEPKIDLRGVRLALQQQWLTKLVRNTLEISLRKELLNQQDREHFDDLTNRAGAAILASEDGFSWEDLSDDEQQYYLEILKGDSPEAIECLEELKDFTTAFTSGGVSQGLIVRSALLNIIDVIQLQQKQLDFIHSLPYASGETITLGNTPITIMADGNGIFSYPSTPQPDQPEQILTDLKLAGEDTLIDIEVAQQIAAIEVETAKKIADVQIKAARRKHSLAMGIAAKEAAI